LTGVWLRVGGRLAGSTAVSVAEVTRRATGVSPVVNPANGGMEHLHGQDAHATKIQPHPLTASIARVWLLLLSRAGKAARLGNRGLLVPFLFHHQLESQKDPPCPVERAAVPGRRCNMARTIADVTPLPLCQRLSPEKNIVVSSIVPGSRQ
jgi:hypothetical protein